jgi:predicted RecB family nuclease
LSAWWDNYLAMPPRSLPTALREPELTLGAGLGAHRLEARYDLLAGEPGGRFVIVDWKTAAHRTQRRVLQDRVQTRVYPWVLVNAGVSLNAGAPIAPQQVEMIYWFAEFPGQPEHFSYDPQQQTADGAFLAQLLQEIETCPADGFTQTQDRTRCQYCAFSSLCWEDDVAQWPSQPDLEPAESDLDEIDLESIAPIPF